MPKIRIDYEVPDNCFDCPLSATSFHLNALICRVFKQRVDKYNDWTYHRCQACIDAELLKGVK